MFYAIFTCIIREDQTTGNFKIVINYSKLLRFIEIEINELRLDESGRERDNDRRLFDSQNNNRGGYNLGNLYYYTESKLQVEWYIYLHIFLIKRHYYLKFLTKKKDKSTFLWVT